MAQGMGHQQCRGRVIREARRPDLNTSIPLHDRFHQIPKEAGHKDQKLQVRCELDADEKDAQTASQSGLSWSICSLYRHARDNDGVVGVCRSLCHEERQPKQPLESSRRHSSIQIQGRTYRLTPRTTDGRIDDGQFRKCPRVTAEAMQPKRPPMAPSTVFFGLQKTANRVGWEAHS